MTACSLGELQRLTSGDDFPIISEGELNSPETTEVATVLSHQIQNTAEFHINILNLVLNTDDPEAVQVIGETSNLFVAFSFLNFANEMLESRAFLVPGNGGKEIGFNFLTGNNLLI